MAKAGGCAGISQCGSCWNAVARAGAEDREVGLLLYNGNWQHPGLIVMCPRDVPTQTLPYYFSKPGTARGAATAITAGASPAAIRVPARRSDGRRRPGRQMHYVRYTLSSYEYPVHKVPTRALGVQPGVQRAPPTLNE